MKNWKKTLNRGMVYLVAVLLGLMAFLFCYNDVLYSLDSLYKDTMYQRSRGVNQNIKIISIDEKTLNAYGPFGTWDRSIYADLLEKMGDYPAVVGFDILFVSEMTPEGDAALREAALKNGNVVFASHIDFDTVAVTDENGKVKIDDSYINMLEKPFTGDEISTGFVNVSPDTDGIVRRFHPTYKDPDGNTLYSFSYEIYRKYCEKKGTTPVVPSVDATGSQWLYYAGKPFDYEAISMVDVVEGNVDPRVFTDCIVLVGVYANGLRDQFSVPNSANEMFGVEINANILQSFMDKVFPLPADRLLISVITGLLVAGILILFWKARLKVAIPVFVVLEAGTVILGIILYTRMDIILPGAYFLTFFLVDFLLSLIINYLTEFFSRKRIASVFRKYVAPQVVDGIMKSGQYEIKLGGETRDVAVLFVDIRGFTPLSESLEPEQVVEILNEYLNLTTNSIFKNSGTLDKFIGDATMAVFNAPFDLEDYELQAIRTAKDIVAGAKALEESCKERFGKKVTFGVGVNCGPAVVGNIGCDFRMDYTAIGDTVNTAARLEANAKAGQVLISQVLYERVKDKGVTANPIGEIPLKGKSKGLFVYELTSIDGEYIGGEPAKVEETKAETKEETKTETKAEQ